MPGVEFYRDEERMPTRATLAHLEYLATLNTDDLTGDRAVENFFDGTEAARSLATIIKRHRTYRPLRTPDIDLDSRLFETEEYWFPVFRGSVYRNPLHPDSSHLIIHGQPKPWELGEENYSYDMFVPVHYDLSYDASRPSQATIRYGVKEPMPRVETFNQAAFREYKEDDPQVLFRVIKEAALDLNSLISYVYNLHQRPAYLGIEEASPKAKQNAKLLIVAKSITNLLK